MTDRTIIRGDSYKLRRPLYTITILDELGGAFDLRECSVMTTYKPLITTIEDDETDATAEIKHEIQIDSNGDVVYSSGILLVGAASGGVIQDVLTAEETAALPLAVPLYADLQLIDENGEVFTWIFEERLTTIDGVTHRALTVP